MTESDRLSDPAWKKWGPYLTERQWGTVREDYSPGGTAWEFISHDMARSKAFRWGEEGIGGICDDQQRLCFALALWNEKDPILKERLFGLTGNEGNHGEDVKELYYYLDNTPTHSYMKYLYKYPHQAFPYKELVEVNKGRGKEAPEYEILDTGVFNDGRYFDVFIEFAKAGEEDILVRIEAFNRGADSSALIILPTVWLRNLWNFGGEKGVIQRNQSGLSIDATENNLYNVYFDAPQDILFCDNETNYQKLYGAPNHSAFCKDGLNEYIVHGNKDAINSNKTGTKAAAYYRLQIDGGQSAVVCLRLTKNNNADPFSDFDQIIKSRLQEADQFYREAIGKTATDEVRMIQRQAFAGMLWSKQLYFYDVDQWLDGDPGQPPPPPERQNGRNSDWRHLKAADIISMPDKWEYPWFAAWDLSYHTIVLAQVDIDFAKEQLLLLLLPRYQHPSGQIPAYEWSFGDVNPPVQAMAALRIYETERQKTGRSDAEFLKKAFEYLHNYLDWWKNQKDIGGNSIFEGGFLGLDNISVFDRSAELPTGGYLEQSDGTAWMAMFCLNMLKISTELALHHFHYESVAADYFEYFLKIAYSMASFGTNEVNLWDENDGFFYDRLHLPDNSCFPLKIRSVVGLIPLCAVEVLDEKLLGNLPEFKDRVEKFIVDNPEKAMQVSRWHIKGDDGKTLLSLLRGHRIKMLLKRILDENEFLSDYGVRSLSKVYEQNPYSLEINGRKYEVKYAPAESDSGLFGGNSNWRGPIWAPVNYLLIASILKFYNYYSDDFKVEYPVGSGKEETTLKEVAELLAKRFSTIFLIKDDGSRALHAQYPEYQIDPHFRSLILFYEYFDGNTGRGVGASHQTGWTGLTAEILNYAR